MFQANIAVAILRVITLGNVGQLSVFNVAYT
jgi:hypothetical protein